MTTYNYQQKVANLIKDGYAQNAREVKPVLELTTPPLDEIAKLNYFKLIQY